MIYLDNAATTMKKPDCVAEAVVAAMSGAGNAARGVNGASLAASRIAADARSELAEFFGFPDPDRVCFTQNATQALNTAIQGILNPGDHVITTAMEHNSVLRPLNRMAESGVKVTIIPADAHGRISLADLEAAVLPETKAVVIQHASNVTGNVNDIGAVGAICRRHGILLIVDAAQTAGLVPIDMEKMHIDVLCFTGHKGLMGPQGTGGILVRDGVAIRPLMEGGSGVHSYDERQPGHFPEALEAGTLNIHGIAGLLASVRWIRRRNAEGIGENFETLHGREIRLARMFYEGVKDMPGITVYGDFSDWSRRTGIVSLNFDGYESGEIADELMESYGIATRSGAHCAPLAHKALGTVETGAVRFSFSPMNTEEEARAAVQAMREMVFS